MERKPSDNYCQSCKSILDEGWDDCQSVLKIEKTFNGTYDIPCTRIACDGYTFGYNLD